MNKSLLHRIEYAGVRLISLLLSVLPMGMLVSLGSGLGWVAFNVFRVRRDVVIDNISRALGVDDRTAASIGRHSYQHLGRSMVEYTAFATMTRDDVNALVELEGREHLANAEKGGKGAVLYAGHFGNWELMGAAIGAQGFPIHFLVGEQSNQLVDDYMNRLRRRQGIGIISRDLALRKVLRALRDNQMVALLGDQNVRKDGTFIDFLGRPASTAKGPAMFAIRAGCPVLVCGIRRISPRHHLAWINPPLWPNADLADDEAVVDLTQRMNDVLAQAIRDYPQEYFWAHRRWKTQPPTSAVPGMEVNADA